MDNIKKLMPAGHRVSVKVDVVEEVSKGGILLAHDNKDRQDINQVTGVLVAIGPTAWNDSSYNEAWAKVGDKVMFARHSGFTVKVAGELMRIMNDEDITAIIEVE